MKDDCGLRTADTSAAGHTNAGESVSPTLDPPVEPPRTSSGKPGVSRRDVIASIGLVPLSAALDWRDAVDKMTRVPRLGSAVRSAQSTVALKFFTEHEFASVRLLADYVIPRDERSGSATDAKVPEWMDAMLADRSVSDDEGRVAMRGGLAWMDRECHARHGKTFVGCTDAERRALLDDIAWPAKAKPELSQGVAFFTRFRDFTASGFFSSRMGAEDLRYMGNKVVPVWDGCPPEALAKLGVSYS